MIEQVRGLAREARPVLAGGGEHRLDRLLADLLGDLGHPFLEQPRRVRARRFVAGARGDRTGETREGAAGRLAEAGGRAGVAGWPLLDRKSTRLNSSHGYISYAVFCLKKKNAATGHVESS